ncbi:MAG: hypothetical protein ABL885_01985 [Methylophilaceae bacterium]
MNISFEESGLMFGPFEALSLFRIEKSKGYIQIQQNTKIAEFLWLSASNKLWVVEAKSSIPKPGTKEYDNYFDEIKFKFINSLALTINGYLKRNMTIYDEFSAKFSSLNWSEIDLRLTLIIPNVPRADLPPITDKFRKLMLSTRKIWKIEETSVSVLNKEEAIKVGLASP